MGDVHIRSFLMSEGVRSVDREPATCHPNGAVEFYVVTVNEISWVFTSGIGLWLHPVCRTFREGGSSILQLGQVPGSCLNGEGSFPIVLSLPLRSVLGGNHTCRLSAVCTGDIRRHYSVHGRLESPVQLPQPVSAKPCPQLFSGHRYSDLST